MEIKKITAGQHWYEVGRKTIGKKKITAIKRGYRNFPVRGNGREEMKEVYRVYLDGALWIETPAEITIVEYVIDET